MRDKARPAGRRERRLTPRIDRALRSFFWGLRLVPLKPRLLSPFLPLSSPVPQVSPATKFSSFAKFPLLLCLPTPFLGKDFGMFSADLATFCSGIKYNGTVNSGASYLVKIEVKRKGRSKAMACSWM